jgi:hypothetical protein
MQAIDRAGAQAGAVPGWGRVDRRAFERGADDFDGFPTASFPLSPFGPIPVAK